MMLRSSVKAFLKALCIYSQGWKFWLWVSDMMFLLWLHGCSAIPAAEPEDYISSVAYEIWLWVLDNDVSIMILLKFLSKIIHKHHNHISQLKPTIYTIYKSSAVDLQGLSVDLQLRESSDMLIKNT